MAKTIRRPIIQIDADKCDGCGLCVTACAEGAIGMVDGKAKLLSDIYCDGLGACLAPCPAGAITLIEREAEEYDETASPHHADGEKNEPACGCPGTRVAAATAAASAGCSCPGMGADEVAPELPNWPIQLRLLPLNAPYLKKAALLLAADCVGFAAPGELRRLLSGRILTVGCPKLDDAEEYVEKLAEIIRLNGIQSIAVLRMSVPCCGGLVRIAQEAVARSGHVVPVMVETVGTPCRKGAGEPFIQWDIWDL